MRRMFVLLCAVVMMVGLAAPAGAAKPTKSTWQYGSAAAEWSEVIETGGGGSTIRYTSVWVNSFADGAFIEIDQFEVRCRVSGGRERCSGGNYRYGWGEGMVTIAGDLSGATAQGTITMMSGRRGQGTPVEVSVQWQGTGSTFRSRSSGSFTGDCYSYRYTSNGQSRNATATGTVGGVDLGSSVWGSIGTDMSREIYRDRCEFV